jgi:hypothetical protein
VARDLRVSASGLTKKNTLLWHHIRGGNALGEPYEIVIEPAVIDMNSECESWAKRGECRRNPSYMLLNCAASCKVKHTEL